MDFVVVVVLSESSVLGKGSQLTSKVSVVISFSTVVVLGRSIVRPVTAVAMLKISTPRVTRGWSAMSMESSMSVRLAWKGRSERSMSSLEQTSCLVSHCNIRTRFAFLHLSFVYSDEVLTSLSPSTIQGLKSQLRCQG